MVLTNNSLSLSESAAANFDEFIVLVCCGEATEPLAPAPASRSRNSSGLHQKYHMIGIDLASPKLDKIIIL